MLKPIWFEHFFIRVMIMSKFKLNPPLVSPYTEKLMLQLLLEHRGFSEVFRESNWRYDNIAEALDLSSKMEICDDFRTKVKKLLQARNKTLPKLTALCVNENPIIQKNIDNLTKLLSLNAAEQALFRLSVQLRLDDPFKKLSKVLPKSNLAKLSEVLLNLFGLQKSDIISALKDRGKAVRLWFARSKLSSESTSRILRLREMLDFDEFISEPLNEQMLLKSCTQPAIETSLNLDDFAYLCEMKIMILDYLQSSFATRRKGGDILIYSPPGTGKTAWAGWLAEQLDMPLLLCKGSDLLDPYVGGTEQKIAEAFESAKRDNCLLVLDEVDTFLFSRDGAERSWERSQVNEMLTQIERFDGLMVVSTNLMNVLDPAALRRFDLKLKFDYLTPQQRLDFAKQQAEKLNLGAWDETHSKRLLELNLLTQGDFAAVARRHNFHPLRI
jgi:raw score 7.09